VIDGAQYAPAKDAAAGAGVSPDCITGWCRDKRIEARRLAGGVWFVNTQSLESYLAARRARSAERAQVARFRAAEKRTIGAATYVPSRDAARIVQLAPDYVSRLARGGLIDGRLVDGLWYVHLPSLQDFVADQERQREIRRADLARRRREEQRAAGHPSALFA
jgi:hypothetical protein